MKDFWHNIYSLSLSLSGGEKDSEFLFANSYSPV